jgi:regulation of enolase protein 1 (concanavalin A-like superfamily)
MDPRMSIATLPAPLVWDRPPAAWSADGDGVVVGAGPRTDLFADPAGDGLTDTAPAALLTPPPGDGAFRCRVGADLRATFDAAVVRVHAGPGQWAKLCLERSPAGIPTLVSVVTRGRSDDANGPAAAAGWTWLRALRRGPVWAFHTSADGRRWELLRLFRFPDPAPVQVGISVQSPVGEGCTARFHDLAWTGPVPGDLRDGA